MLALKERKLAASGGVSKLFLLAFSVCEELLAGGSGAPFFSGYRRRLVARRGRGSCNSMIWPPYAPLDGLAC